MLEGFDDDLVFGAARIAGNAPGCDHFQSVFRTKGQTGGHPLPADGVQDGVLIFQGEIKVARGRTFEAGDLSANAHAFEPGLKGPFDRLRNFGNRELGKITRGALVFGKTCKIAHRIG